MLKSAACPGNAADLWLAYFQLIFIPFLKITWESGGSLWAECVLVVAACFSFLSFLKTLNTLMDCEKRGTKEQAALAL